MSDQDKDLSPEIQAKIVRDYVLTQNYSEVARRYGTSEESVRNWVARLINRSDLADIFDAKKRELIEQAWDTEREALNELKKRISSMSDRDLVLFFGVLDDKRTRATGEATEIVEERQRSFQLIVTEDGRIEGVETRKETRNT